MVDRDSLSEHTIELDLVDPVVEVYSLEEEEAGRIGAYIEKALSLKVRYSRLEHSSLRRRRQPKEGEESRQLQLVVHAVDGRTLLVDQDGFYNHFLSSGGNVCLALSGIRTDEATAVAELIAAGQASIEYLSQVGRFFAFDHEPTSAHLKLLRRLTENRAPVFHATESMKTALGDTSLPVLTNVASSARGLVKKFAIPLFAHISSSLTASDTDASPSSRMYDDNGCIEDGWVFCEDIDDLCELKRDKASIESILPKEEAMCEEEVICASSLPSSLRASSTEDNCTTVQTKDHDDEGSDSSTYHDDVYV